MAVYADNKTKQNIGIICDFCNQIFTQKFTYYSTKVELIEVDSAISKIGVIDVDKRHLELDICPTCMDKMKKTVLDNISKRQGQGQGSGSWSSTSK